MLGTVLYSYTAVFIKSLLGSEFCIECINVQQRSDSRASSNSLVLIPRLRFSCNGRLSSVRAGLDKPPNFFNFLTFQLWRPFLPSTTIYNKVGEIHLESDYQVTQGYNNLEATIILTGEKRIEFQPGDIIGYYQPPQSRYRVLDVDTMGYVLYRFDGMFPPNTLSLSEATKTLNNRQPLLHFTFGKNTQFFVSYLVYNYCVLLYVCVIDIRCYNLSVPANGEITSCSSRRVGVGYEGDTCSFTCNTGYELTGSDTRTCQSDRSWNGSDVKCRSKYA